MKPNPVSELRSYIAAFAERCKAARWMACLFHVSVVADIAADVAEQQKKIELRAYSAQQAAHEAARLMDAVLEDGRVLPFEIAQLRLARRHLGRSEKASEQAVEMAQAA